jgi:hypothetical protein
MSAIAIHFNYSRCVVRLALVLLAPTFASAEVDPRVPPPACKRIMDNIAQGSSVTDLSDISKSALCLWELFSDDSQELKRALRAAGTVQKGSATIQPGAPSGSNGTTSAVSKPVTPLSLATEYGGITSSTSNQTMTLQTTLGGLPSALAGKGIEAYCWSRFVTIPNCIKQKQLEMLNRFGFGVTANTSTSSQNTKGTASPPQGTAQQASLTSASNSSPSLSNIFVKVTLVNGDYQKPDSVSNAKSLIPSVNLNKAQQLIIAAFQKAPASMFHENPDDGVYQQWKKCIEAKFTQSSLATHKHDDLFAQYYSQIGAILFGDGSLSCDSSTSVPTSVTQWLARPNPRWAQWQKDLANAINNYIAAVSVFEAQMLKGAGAPVLSLEYDYNTPVSQPTTSTIKLVGSKAFGPKICTRKQNKKDTDGNQRASSQDSVAVNQYTGTINVGGNFYNSTPSGVPGAGAFRDFQAGAEVDMAFCTSAISVIGSYLGNSTLGLTYYYQDQVSPSILKVTPGMPLPGISITGLAPSTSSVFTKKGPINFVQLKYGLGVGKNVKFPIAVSWSNRSDLITHSLWGVQFGVSYDFSSLFTSSGSTNKAGSSDGSSN